MEFDFRRRLLYSTGTPSPRAPGATRLAKRSQTMNKLPHSRTNKSIFYQLYKLLRFPFLGREIVEAEEQLKQYKFNRKSTVLELLAILLVLTGVSVIVSITVTQCNLQQVPWSQAFTAILSLGIAIIAYRQWRAARHEISIDKYYDRLETANKRLEALETDKPTVEDMHAFAELDKLEYVIVKYEYGYISPVLALRALKNFHKFCTDRKGFREKASAWVYKASYREITRSVVTKVCEECERSSDPQ